MTLAVGQVMFLQPIHVSELVTFLASVNYTGTSSMAIGIRVVTGNIQQRTQRHANSCYFTMVAVDANRKPQAVPPLVPETGEQQPVSPRPGAQALAPGAAWQEAPRATGKLRDGTYAFCADAGAGPPHCAQI